ncbi:MAG: hypothetical protein NC089_01840 [Bacteroides sp.]|nr:hypothetical protein [Bacteroides sp.]MCM1548866.1 hypothetical protein [Clostridium sp.]
MIIVTAQYNQDYVSLSFPCADSEMEQWLIPFQGRDKSDFNLFIAEVHEPKDLSMLRGCSVYLDELNYLAKRLESLDQREEKQFFAAVHHCGFTQLKDCINLTFNLSRFTLIQDVSSMEAVGRLHQLTLSGGLSEEEMEAAAFEDIGRKLLECGRGRITKYGILFVNEEIPFDEVYDGQVFPQYIYEECLVIAELSFHGKTEYAYLPCEGISISKALHRLNAGNLQECSVNLFAYTLDDKEWLMHLRDILESEGLYAVNQFANAVSGFKGQEDWKKLTAVTEYANVRDSKSLTQIAAKMDCFMLLPDVNNQEELARYWIAYREEYELSPGLEDFFLYEPFGEYIEIHTGGKFLASGGFVYIDNGQSLDEIIGEKIEESQEKEEKHMMMGGM